MHQKFVFSSTFFEDEMREVDRSRGEFQKVEEKDEKRRTNISFLYSPAGAGERAVTLRLPKEKGWINTCGKGGAAGAATASSRGIHEEETRYSVR